MLKHVFYIAKPITIMCLGGDIPVGKETIKSHLIFAIMAL